ncbi:MAG TPA: hypothetical protein VFZ66_30155 [Herpetosiphonaceae bacterium]
MLLVALALLGVVTLVAVDRVRSHAAGVAPAQSALAEYAIDWFTIDGGGAMNSSGGVYGLSGTIGQHDAGASIGSPYELNGGFWPGAQARYIVALPIAAK